MKIEDLTLRNFQDYIFENLEKEISFQNSKEIKALDKEEFLFERFELTKTDHLKSEEYGWVSFRIYINLNDIDEINNHSTQSLLEGFVRKHKLENLKMAFYNLGYFCTNDNQFELELNLCRKLKGEKTK